MKSSGRTIMKVDDPGVGVEGQRMTPGVLSYEIFTSTLESTTYDEVEFASERMTYSSGMHSEQLEDLITRKS
uniref:EFG_C domain-containing protein n=1 Tax=Angiostrongylus cantonensis TaxID=6313 RepID=A0A0K0DDZ7_ANGCA